ncbi:hypothetical protein TBR22_A18110 [Luteitalea sp. TBR-22]|uniref:hypothetical protein n=1 Tax=Luteitalea sp. TBR-22 TaxID=2802971 RepID=UPI001AF3EFB4|nr:hypothetical protein [Luteitalea sp. TBR-22]BCS32597.1 hypothetical protein TBR22_A18110 [Luteitalea sp. TBR-22]
MLTGLQVFEGGPPTRAYVHHVHTLPTPPSQVAPRPVPADLEALVMACLEKDPARRPQDAGEVLIRCDACRLPRQWSPTDAMAWWHAHLPDLTGPVSFGTRAQ